MSCCASSRSFQVAIVRDHEGASLGRGQVIEAKGRHLAPAELAASEQPAVTGDHLIVTIDQDWDIEAKGLDAVGDLPDLLLAVEPRVRGIGLEFFDRPINDFKRLDSPV